MLAVASHAVEGHVSRGFEAVREAFAENFTRRHELGGACCAYFTARRSSTCGAGSATSRRASRGSGTRWCSCTRPPRACPR